MEREPAGTRRGLVGRPPRRAWSLRSSTCGFVQSGGNALDQKNRHRDVPDERLHQQRGSADCANDACPEAPPCGTARVPQALARRASAPSRLAGVRDLEQVRQRLPRSSARTSGRRSPPSDQAVSGLRRVSFTHPRSRVSPWSRADADPVIRDTGGRDPVVLPVCGLPQQPDELWPVLRERRAATERLFRRVRGLRAPRTSRCVCEDGNHGVAPSTVRGAEGAPSAAAGSVTEGGADSPTAVHCATVPGVEAGPVRSWRRLGIANRIPWSEPSRLTLGTVTRENSWPPDRVASRTVRSYAP